MLFYQYREFTSVAECLEGYNGSDCGNGKTLQLSHVSVEAFYKAG